MSIRQPLLNSIGKCAGILPQRLVYLYKSADRLHSVHCNPDLLEARVACIYFVRDDQ